MTRSAFSERHRELRTRLIAARQRQKVTQAALARRLNRPQSFVSKYERGERRLDVVEYLETTEALGIDPIRFLRDFVRTAR